MNDLNSPAYYRRPQQQELTLARAATMPTIAEIHQQLADRYAAIASEAEAREPGPRLTLVNG